MLKYTTRAMSQPVFLNDVTKDGLKKFLDSFDHVFSDCDGVIWTRNTLPGSGDFFKLMQKLGKSTYFVSNNSIRTKENYTKMFTAAGIENGFERLTIPSVAIAGYLNSINFNKQVYCVSCKETQRVLESNGFKCQVGPEVMPDDIHDFVDYLEDDLDVGAVVFDSDFKVNLPKLYKATAYLRRSEVIFICGASDRHVPMKPGCLGLGVGVFTDIVKDEVKREPILLGKPGKMFGELAMKRANVTDPSRVLFIGDMMEQDIGLGKNVGFRTMLVLTNCTKEEMLSHNTIQPDYYASCLGDLVPALREIVN